VNEWESDFCGGSGCEPEILEQAKETIATTCAKDLNRDSVIPKIAMAVLGQPELMREFLCTTDKVPEGENNKKGKKGVKVKRAGDYCFRQVMADLEVRGDSHERMCFHEKY